MREAISISIEADRDYVEVLKKIAKAESCTVAKLVRNAVDARYGHAISEVASIDAASDRKVVRLLEKTGARVETQ